MPKHLNRESKGEPEREKTKYEQNFGTPSHEEMELRRQMRQIDDMEFKRKHRAKVRKELGL
jgi:hypothetical protein